MGRVVKSSGHGEIVGCGGVVDILENERRRALYRRDASSAMGDGGSAICTRGGGGGRGGVFGERRRTFVALSIDEHTKHVCKTELDYCSI